MGDSENGQEMAPHTDTTPLADDEQCVPLTKNASTQTPELSRHASEPLPEVHQPTRLSNLLLASETSFPVPDVVVCNNGATSNEEEDQNNFCASTDADNLAIFKETFARNKFSDTHSDTVVFVEKEKPFGLRGNKNSYSLPRLQSKYINQIANEEEKDEKKSVFSIFVKGNSEDPTKEATDASYVPNPIHKKCWISDLPPHLEKKRQRFQNCTDSLALFLLLPGLFLSAISPVLLVPSFGIPNPYSFHAQILFIITTVLSLTMLIVGGTLGNTMWYYDDRKEKWRMTIHCGKGPNSHFFGKGLCIRKSKNKFKAGVI